VKLVLAEDGSDDVARYRREAARVATASIGYVEVRAALAAARRARRLRPRSFAATRRAFDELWAEVAVVVVDDTLVQAAADAADTFALRAGDAVHLAAAIEIATQDSLLVTWDRDLSRAGSEAGLVVAP
jgi:hypothetical protein